MSGGQACAGLRASISARANQTAGEIARRSGSCIQSPNRSSFSQNPKLTMASAQAFRRVSKFITPIFCIARVLAKWIAAHAFQDVYCSLDTPILLSKVTCKNDLHGRKSNLPNPPFHIGNKTNGRAVLLALAEAHNCDCKRVDVLLEGHIASLNYIAKEWSNVTGLHRGLLLKRWTHSLFPSGNQPFGSVNGIAKAFETVGRKYVDRDGNWRLHSSNLQPHTKWKKAALKCNLRRSARSATPSVKRSKSRPVPHHLHFLK